MVIRQNRDQTSTDIVGLFVADGGEDLAWLIFPGCTTLATSGDCRAFSCGGAALQGISAGDTISFIVNGGALEPVQMLTDGLYQRSFETLLYEEGDSIIFVAPGAEFPQLEAMLTAPSVPNASLPTGEIDTTAPLTMTWTPGAIGDEVLVSLAGTGDAQVVCRTAAASGSLTIPTEVLSNVTGDGSLTLVNQTTQTFNASGSPVHLAVGEMIGSPVTFR